MGFNSSILSGCKPRELKYSISPFGDFPYHKIGLPYLKNIVESFTSVCLKISMSTSFNKGLGKLFKHSIFS